jgi:predicted nucleic acid-binding protein
MIDYSIDTNVFSQVFRGNAPVKSFVESLSAAVCATVYIECLQGSKSNQEKHGIKKYLANFSLLHATPDVSKNAVNLIDVYSNSHGLLLADALIAASAIEYDLTLITYNVDDFKFIQNLKWLKSPV